MDLTEIKKQHPSICYDCTNSRRVWSKNRVKEGRVGCARPVMFPYRQDSDDISKVINESVSKEAATGWVGLSTNPEADEMNGMITNEQLIQLETKSCNYFEKR